MENRPLLNVFSTSMIRKQSEETTRADWLQIVFL